MEQRNVVPSKLGVVSGLLKPSKEPKSLAVGIMTPTSARLIRNLDLDLSSTDKTKQDFHAINSMIRCPTSISLGVPSLLCPSNEKLDIQRPVLLVPHRLPPDHTNIPWLWAGSMSRFTVLPLRTCPVNHRTAEPQLPPANTFRSYHPKDVTS